MTGSSAAGSSQPVHINMLTSHVTQHGNTRLINRPEGLIMSWEAPANMNVIETSHYIGVSNLRHDITTDMATGDTTSVAHAHFTHEEYEAYRNSPQGRVMELPPMPPEKMGNTIGTLTFMPSPNPARAEYANPPEIPPEDIEDPEAPPGKRTSQRLEELKAEREAINQRLINPDAADEYVRFNDLHSSADGLIGQLQGTPGTAGDYAAQGSRAILGFLKDAFLGIGELAYEGTKLAVSAQQNMTNPAAMYGQVLDAQILAENVRLGNVTTGTMANGAMSTVTNVGNALIAPVTQPWANGQYVEAATRGVIEVATLPLVALKSGKVAKTADALTDAATANKVTDAADAGDAAKAPEPQGPNGNGGKIAQQKKKPSYVIGQSDGGPGTWQKETTPTKGSEYQEKVTGAPKDTEYVVETDRMKSGKKKFDGYDPETNTLTDAKDWVVGPKGWPPEGQDWASKNVAKIAEKDAAIARDVGANLEYHVPTQKKAAQLREIFRSEDVKGVKVVVTPKG